jgi:hypothetical protein
MTLEDWHAACLEDLHPGFVIVHAENMMSDLRKTNGRYKSHVTGPNHTDGNWL